MKTSSLVVASIVCSLSILSLFSAAAVPLAHGQVSFLQPVTLNIGQGGGNGVYADFNRDGKLDLAFAGSVLLGNGDGTFQAPINLSVTGNLVAAVDFNGDGIPDLLVASTSSTVLNVFLGNGDGSFQAPKSTNVGSTFSAIIAADVNGDGKADVLGLVFGGQVFVFLGNGDGTFKAGVPYNAGPNPYIILTGDFNGDGKLDVATASANPGEIAVMLGNGNGTFQPPVTSTGVASPVDMKATDVKGDGKLDLIISDSSTNQTYTFFGNGDGTFQAGIVAAPVAGTLGVADLNGDSKVDLVVGGGLPFSQMFLGNGDGTFTYAHAYFGNGGILIADFNSNNNANLDLVLGQTILLGNGNGTFNGQPVAPLPGGYVGATGDFNGDGYPDLAVSSFNNPSDVYILLGDGLGSLTLEHTYPLAVPGYSIATGDLNDDVKVDLVILTLDSVSQDWSVNVLLGNGDGTFGPPKVYAQGTNPASPVLIADLSGDHKPDALTLQLDSLIVFPNNGDGTLGAPVPYFAGTGANGFVVADFNGDGKLDAAVSSSAGIGILLGNGDGAFQGATFITTGGNGAVGIVTGDFNNDGKSDLIVGAENGGQVFLGNGNGTFTALAPAAPIPAKIVGIADFNGDGNLDLAQSSCPGSTAQFELWCVSLGNGDGTFGNPINVMTNYGDTSGGLAVVADFNQDQKPDIGIELDTSFGSPAGLFILLNTTPPAPGASVSPTAVNFPSQAAGTSSSPVGVSVSNPGKGVLTLSGVTFTGNNASELSQTNNCTTIQPGANCTIKVVFSPTASGNATAGMKIADNAVTSPQIVTLSGTATAAPDFAIDPTKGSSNSATVTAGQTATFNLAVTPAGSFSGMVSLSCAITPAVTPAPVCTVPALVNVTQGTAAPVTAKISTTPTGTAGSISHAKFTPGATAIQWMIVLLASSVLFAGYRRRKPLLAIPMIAVAFFGMTACGGGSSSTTTPPGTPAGTYTATVTAKSGSLSHNTALTLIVQ
jgi:hypothetical protein